MTRPEDFIAQVRSENRDFYDTEEGRGLLETFLPRTFPEPWIYIFEFIQNALDVGAKHIEITTRDDAMVFAHDGKPLAAPHVRALSKLGMSTKGINTVGFMGVGFKSVFHRFYKVGVSDSVWKFGFHLTTDIGPKGDIHPHWVQTVLPEWWSELPEPEGEVTTAFYFSKLRDSKTPLKDDLERLFDPQEPITLAVLAVRGLESLTINGDAWLLDYDAEQQIVTLVRGNDAADAWTWCAVVHEYAPSEDALRRLLEFRKQRVKEEELNDLAKPRQVVGFVPLNAVGEPEPPRRGRVYSALPTDETICLGMHLQGDWFVDVTRQGLMAVANDPWQQEIFDQTPKLVARYIKWLVSDETRSERAIRKGLRVLQAPDEESPQSKLDALLAHPDDTYVKECLEDELSAITFVPVHTEDSRRFVQPAEAIFLPDGLANSFGRRPERRPDLLFGGGIAHSGLFEQSTLEMLGWLGLCRYLDPKGLQARWPAALQRWWEALKPEPDAGKSQQRQQWLTLFDLWNSIERLAWRNEAWAALPVAPTAEGTWVPLAKVRYLDLEPPTLKDEGGTGVLKLLEGKLPTAAQTLPVDLFRYLQRGVIGEESKDRSVRTSAYSWFEQHAVKKSLSGLIGQAQRAHVGVEPLPVELFIDLARWAVSRNQLQAVEYVLVEDKRGCRAVRFAQALLADPYVEDGTARRVIFRFPPISARYLQSGERSRHIWTTFFQQRGARGALKLTNEGKRFYSSSVQEMLDFIGAQPGSLKQANASGYRIFLWDFEDWLNLNNGAALQRWLESNSAILKGRGRMRAERTYYGENSPIQGTRPTPWLKKLLRLSWVLGSDGQRHTPGRVLSPNRSDLSDYEGSPVAKINDDLLRILEAEGVQFGADLSRSRALRLLERDNGKLSSAKLTEHLERALEECQGSEVEQARFMELLPKLHLPNGGPPLARLVLSTGPRHRSGLNGFVVAMGSLEEPLQAVLKKCPLPPQPGTTTGTHALEFLLDVWGQAASDTPPPAEPLRGALPLAYGYVLTDIESDSALQERWEQVRHQARLYTEGRRWTPLGENLCLNDINDPRLKKFVPEALQLATAGHLGEGPEQQLQAAESLDLKLLSAYLNPKALPGVRVVQPDWEGRFNILVNVLRQRQKNPTTLALQVFSKLSLRVGSETLSISAWRTNETLQVSGEPMDFGADAATELVGVYQLSQQGVLVPHLTTALNFLDDENRFLRACKNLAERLEVKFEQSLPEEPPADQPAAKDSPQPEPKPPTGSTTGTTRPRSERRESGGTRGPSNPNRPSGTARPSKPTNKPSKYAPDWRGLIRVASGASEPSGDGPTRSPKDDKRGRAAVIAFERARGRVPTEKAVEQPGFDVESRAPDGTIRRIEIKGNSAIWHGESSVVLSQRQFDDARTPPASVEYWLYVVDELSTPRPRVVPLRWTDRALKFFFHAEDWEQHALEPGRVDLPIEVDIDAAEVPMFDPLQSPPITGLDLDALEDE